jgi:hypothetical protein
VAGSRAADVAAVAAWGAVASVDEHRAVGVRGAVHADRSEQDVCELAVAAAADDQQVGVTGGVDQDGPG